MLPSEFQHQRLQQSFETGIEEQNRNTSLLDQAEFEIGDTDETNTSASNYGFVHETAAAEENTNVGGVLADAVDLVCEIVDTVLEIPGARNLDKLEVIQVKLDLWADGVEVTTGRLERVLKPSNGLKESIFMIWLAFFRYLTKDKTTEFYTTIVKKHFCRIVALTEKINYSHQISLDEKFLAVEVDTTVYMPTNRSNLESEIENFIQEFQVFQERLSRIAPFVMTFLRDFEGDEEAGSLSGDDIELDNDWKAIHEERLKTFKDLKPQDWYRNNIREKFRTIDDEVSDIIAKELWELYRNVKATLYQQNPPIYNKVGGVEAAQAIKAKTVIEHDSTYESMQSLAASMIRPPPRKFEIALSDIASDFSTSSVQLKSRPRVPPPPEGVIFSQDESFKCPFCLEMLSGIDSAKAWRKHVLGDIRPYFCTFASCNFGSVRYKSKTEWMAHEVNSHRLRSFWICKFDPCTETDINFDTEQKFFSHLVSNHRITYDFKHSAFQDLLNSSRHTELNPSLSFCKICQKELPNRASRLASHIGRHLEDFALPILSQLDDRECESDKSDCSSDSNSNNSEIAAAIPRGTFSPEPVTRLYGTESYGHYPPLEPLRDSDEGSTWDIKTVQQEAKTQYGRDISGVLGGVERTSRPGESLVPGQVTLSDLDTDAHPEKPRAEFMKMMKGILEASVEIRKTEQKVIKAQQSLTEAQRALAVVPQKLMQTPGLRELEPESSREDIQTLISARRRHLMILEGKLRSLQKEQADAQATIGRIDASKTGFFCPYTYTLSGRSVIASCSADPKPTLKALKHHLSTLHSDLLGRRRLAVSVADTWEQLFDICNSPWNEMLRSLSADDGHTSQPFDKFETERPNSSLLGGGAMVPESRSRSKLPKKRDEIPEGSKFFGCPLERIGHPDFLCRVGSNTLSGLRQHIKQIHTSLFSEDLLRAIEYPATVTWAEVFQHLFKDWPEIALPSCWLSGETLYQQLVTKGDPTTLVELDSYLKDLSAASQAANRAARKGGIREKNYYDPDDDERNWDNISIDSDEDDL